MVKIKIDKMWGHGAQETFKRRDNSEEIKDKESTVWVFRKYKLKITRKIRGLCLVILTSRQRSQIQYELRGEGGARLSSR